MPFYSYDVWSNSQINRKMSRKKNSHFVQFAVAQSNIALGIPLLRFWYCSPVNSCYLLPSPHREASMHPKAEILPVVAEYLVFGSCQSEFCSSRRPGMIPDGHVAYVPCYQKATVSFLIVFLYLFLGYFPLILLSSSVDLRYSDSVLWKAIFNLKQVTSISITLRNGERERWKDSSSGDTRVG